LFVDLAYSYLGSNTVAVPEHYKHCLTN